jgi:hypothetical protein
MISHLLSALKPDEYLQIRDAFENEYTAIFHVEYEKKKYWVGVNVPDDRKPEGREGFYAYGTD